MTAFPPVQWGAILRIPFYCTFHLPAAQFEMGCSREEGPSVSLMLDNSIPRSVEARSP